MRKEKAEGKLPPAFLVSFGLLYAFLEKRVMLRI
jgi:hypothetical protein